jgi:lysozyme
MFLFNWALAKTLKIKRGAYHYFTFCRNGKAQAENFLETAKFERGDLPPVIDIEFGGNCERNVFKKEQLIAEIQAFIEEVENLYCAKPIIYTTNEFYKDYIAGNFLDCPIWIRDVLTKPQLPDNRQWAFWQYRIDTLAGIEGEVDMNVFNGDEESFSHFVLDSCRVVESPPHVTLSP